VITAEKKQREEEYILKKIYNMCYRRLGNYHDAWDLTQEVFMELEKGRHKWENAQSKWAWAVAVFRYQLKRFWRVSSKYKNYPIQDDYVSQEVGQEEKTFLEEEVDQTMKILKSMNPEMAEALIYFCVEKLPIKEIAKIQKISESAAKWRIFEAKRRMAAKLKEKRDQ